MIWLSNLSIGDLSDLYRAASNTKSIDPQITQSENQILQPPNHRTTKSAFLPPAATASPRRFPVLPLLPELLELSAAIGAARHELLTGPRGSVFIILSGPSRGDDSPLRKGIL